MNWMTVKVIATAEVLLSAAALIIGVFTRNVTATPSLVVRVVIFGCFTLFVYKAKLWAAISLALMMGLSSAICLLFGVFGFDSADRIRINVTWTLLAIGVAEVLGSLSIAKIALRAVFSEQKHC